MKYIVIVALFFCSQSSFSAPFHRSGLTIKTWHPASSNRVDSPSYSGNTRVYFDNSAAWGTSGCREDSADISIEDTHIISTMLAAFMAGKTMKVEVSDAIPKLSGVCKITAVFINK
jgi:hypothetical protein